MSDWADEKAKAVIGGGPWLRKERDAISSALRQARIEALEEALRAVMECFVVPASEEETVLHNGGVASAEASIRALKDKQP